MSGSEYMSLFRQPVIVEIYHEFSEKEQKEYKNFRYAKRAVLDAMYDNNTDVYGANFSLLNGQFLKEIHF